MSTYRDAAIQQRIAERFIPVRVDQDADAGPALHGDAFFARGDAARRTGPQPPIDRNR